MGRKNVEGYGLVDPPADMNCNRPCVYFAHSRRTGLVKIGYSRSPYWRVHDLALSRRDWLRIIALIPGGHDAEWALHHRFEHLRVRREPQDGGYVEREWFEFGAEIRDFLSTTTEAIPLRTPKHSVAVPA